MRRGLTLAESLLSMFLLAMGAFTCLTLLIQSLGHQTRTTQVLEAQQLLSNTLEAVRSWAYDPDHFFGDWSPYDNDVVSGPGADYQIVVSSGPRSPAFSPNRSLEEPRGAEARRMEDSFVPVTVRIQWGSGRSLSATTWLGKPVQPVRNGNEIVVARTGGASDPVPPQALVDFAAELYSTSGNAIPGVAIQWQVLPYEEVGFNPGNALFYPNRGALGRVGQLQHRFYGGDPDLNLPPYKVPGWVVLRAVAVYQGIEYQKVSDPIELAP